MNTVVLALRATIVVDAAARYDQDVGPLPNFKMVVNHVVDARICNNNGDVYALIFGMWLYNNVNTGFILLGDNFNIGTGLARNARSIFRILYAPAGVPCRSAIDSSNCSSI